MKNVPEMITEKDLLYLEDMFNWNIIIRNKINYYLNLVDNKEVINMLNNLLEMHHNYLEDIISYMEEN